MSFLFHTRVSSNLPQELILHSCRWSTEWRLQPSTPSCFTAPYSTSHCPLLNRFITCVSMACVQACTWLRGQMEVTSRLWDVCSLLPPLIGFQDLTLILKLVSCGKMSLSLLGHLAGSLSFNRSASLAQEPREGKNKHCTLFNPSMQHNICHILILIEVS